MPPKKDAKKDAGKGAFIQSCSAAARAASLRCKFAAGESRCVCLTLRLAASPTLAGGAGEITPEMQMRAMALQIEQLQKELADRTARALASERELEGLRSIVKVWESDLAKAANTTTDITADMARQYKAMQQSMQLRITTLEGDVARMKEEVAAANASAADAAAERDAAVAAKDLEIESLKLKMEDMASEFGDMLADTLRRMGERIDITADGRDDSASASLPMLKAMEEVTASMSK